MRKWEKKMANFNWMILLELFRNREWEREWLEERVKRTGELKIALHVSLMWVEVIGKTYRQTTFIQSFNNVGVDELIDFALYLGTNTVFMCMHACMHIMSLCSNHSNLARVARGLHWGVPTLISHRVHGEGIFHLGGTHIKNIGSFTY